MSATTPMALRHITLTKIAPLQPFISANVRALDLDALGAGGTASNQLSGRQTISVVIPVPARACRQLMVELEGTCGDQKPKRLSADGLAIEWPHDAPLARADISIRPASTMTLTSSPVANSLLSTSILSLGAKRTTVFIRCIEHIKFMLVLPPHAVKARCVPDQAQFHVTIGFAARDAPEIDLEGSSSLSMKVLADRATALLSEGLVETPGYRDTLHPPTAEAIDMRSADQAGVRFSMTPPGETSRAALFLAASSAASLKVGGQERVSDLLTRYRTIWLSTLFLFAGLFLGILLESKDNVV